MVILLQVGVSEYHPEVRVIRCGNSDRYAVRAWRQASLGLAPSPRVRHGARHVDDRADLHGAWIPALPVGMTLVLFVRVGGPAEYDPPDALHAMALPESLIAKACRVGAGRVTRVR